MRWVLLLGAATSLLGASLDLRHPAPDRIVLAWPETPPAALEERPSLAPEDPWRPFPGVPTNSGGSNVVELAPGGRERYFRLVELPARAPTRLAEISPHPGEAGVAVTRETIVRFTRPLRAESPLGTDRFFAESGGRRILSRVELSQDRQAATLFHLENLPGAGRIQVTLDAEGLADVEGKPLDVDGDGLPGGVGRWSFDTAGLSGLAGTAVVGRVLASEKRGGTNVPLAGVTITVDGAEESLRAVTGPDGSFSLNPSPAGRFFVHVDGRTAVGSQWPGGAYYPFVGKAWEAVAGRTNNPASGSGEVFLPLVPAAALQPVSATETTVVSFPAEVLAANPALAGVRLDVPPNALFADNGARGGRLGIAPVAPDRLPEPLPPGLNLPLVITIQSDGPMNFDRPVPVRFPNLPDPVTGRKLPPGARTAIWSFNHDTGRWEIAAPATVTPDGDFVVSDAGAGVRQPGWHGAAPGTQPGEPGGGPGGGGAGDGGGGGGGGAGSVGGSSDCEGSQVAQDAYLDLADCVGDVAGFGQWVEAGTDFVRNLRDYWAVANQAAEATATPGFSCERVAAAVGLLNVTGRTIADVAAPFLSEGDPTRLSVAAANCAISGARNAGRLACFVRCRRGTTTSERCGQMDAIANAGQGLLDLTQTDLQDADSAVGLGINLAEASGNLLVSALNEHCAGRRAGLAGDANTEAQLRQRTLEHLEATTTLRARAERAAEIGTRILAELNELIGTGVGMASAWMIEDRGWAGGYYRLSAEDDEFRARVGRAGEFRLPILAPETRYLLEVYEPLRGVYGRVEFASAIAGWRTTVPAPLVVSLRDRARYPDSDGDGLADVVERVLGTRTDRADSDGDGRGDSLEVAEGSDPVGLGGAVPDGVMANVAGPGQAVDLAEVGDDLLAVATASGSVALFRTTDPDAPLAAGVIPGGRREVRLAGAPGMLLVSEESAGLRLYDVVNPAVPVLRWTQGDFNRISAMAIAGDRVLYVSGQNLVAREAGSGAELFRTDVGSAEALLPLGSRWALLAGTELRFLEVGPGGVVPRAALAVPDLGIPGAEWGRRLASADGLLVGGGAGGFLTADLAGPEAWVLRGTPAPGQASVFDAVFLDGQMLATVVREAGVADSRVGIHDLRDRTDVTRRLATYDTPGDARALEWHRGRLVVADGPAGLTVIRHDAVLPPSGAPTLALAGDFTSPAGQEALAPYTLRARLSGGHRGRVEYFLNGVRLGRTFRFPHVLSDVAPASTGAAPSLTFTARAVTLAGITVESAPLVVPLSRDVTAPRVTDLTPGRLALVGLGTVRDVVAVFSEELHPATVTEGSLGVFLAGPDGLFGTTDDQLVAGTLVRPARVRSLGRVFAAPLAPGRYQARLSEALADAAGNRLVPPLAWEFTVETPRQWVSDADGSWGEFQNWLDEVLPRSGDSVLIDRPAANPLVTLRNNPFFPLTINRLVSREPFQLDGALQVRDLALFEGPLWLTNSSRLQSDNRIEVRGPVTWSGSGSPFLLAGSFSSAGHARLALATAQMLFLQPPVGARGEFVNEATGLFEMISGGQQALNGFGSVPQFVNRGTFRAVAPGGGTNRVSNLFFDNQGVIEVASGTLELAFGLTNRGRLVVPTGTRLDISGHQFEATRDASLEGGGEVRINLPVFGGLGSPVIGGTVDLGGRLEVLGPSPVFFAGDRVRLNRLEVANLDVQFRPLSFSAQTVFLRWGMVTIASPTPVELPELVAEPAGAGGDGRVLRVETPVTVTGPARLESLWVAGGAPLRLAGPISLASILKISALSLFDPVGGIVELAAPLPLEGGAEVEVASLGELRVLSGVEFDLPEGTRVRLYGTLVNDGVVRTAAGLGGMADAANGGTVLNRGRLESRSGLLRLPLVRQTGGTTRLAGGQLACLQGLQVEGGVVEGAGDCLADLTNPGGTLSPGGVGIGTLNIGQEPVSGQGGNLAQSGSGRLLLQLAATDRHDRLTVHANATLGGLLEVQLAEGFTPALGDAFTILTCGGSLSGTFAEARLPDLAGGLEFEVRYEAQAVQLRVRERP